MTTKIIDKFDAHGVMGMRVLEGRRNPTLNWILNGFGENFEHKLNTVKKTWNQKIRNFYRDILSLSTRDNPIQATFLVDDDGRFTDLIEKYYPGLDFAEMVALKRYVSEVDRVEQYYKGVHEHEQLSSSKQYALDRLQYYDLREIIRRLFDLYNRTPGSDVFGRYYITKHTVEVYLLPCIIFSMLIEEDFLDMLIGTLAHELAHGFHHVGRDKDGFIWNEFSKAEPSLVEGLAEFYTREFARSVEITRPTVLQAFKKTARFLSPEYRRYEQWGDTLSHEAVYQAFIETRRSGVLGFEEFERGLARTSVRLRSDS